MSRKRNVKERYLPQILAQIIVSLLPLMLCGLLVSTLCRGYIGKPNSSWHSTLGLWTLRGKSSLPTIFSDLIIDLVHRTWESESLTIWFLIHSYSQFLTHMLLIKLDRAGRKANDKRVSNSNLLLFYFSLHLAIRDNLPCPSLLQSRTIAVAPSYPAPRYLYISNRCLLFHLPSTASIQEHGRCQVSV